MNEPDPREPARPGASDDATAADGAWFRAQLDPVLDADDGPDGIEAGWQALAGAAASPATPAPLAARHGWSKRIAISAAAAVLVIVVAAAVVTATRSDDTVEPLSTEAEQPTGWYVPVGLPDGWKLETVEAYPGRTACERRGTQWSDPAEYRSLGVEFDGCGHAPTADDVPDMQIPGASPSEALNATLHEVELGGGVTASGIRMPASDSSIVELASLSWNASGGAWTVRAAGLDYDQLVAVAKRLAADPARTDLGIDGLEEVDRWSAPARDRTPEVQVNLVNPDGLRTSYHLALPGDGPHPADSVLVPMTVAGQTNPVFRYDTYGFWAGRYGGSWPGADLIVFRWTEGPTDSEHMITDAGLEELIGALRPATAGEWRAFLATATGTVSPALLDAPSLEALGDTDFAPPTGPDAEPTTTTPSNSVPATAPEPTATTTAPPSQPFESPWATVAPATDGQPRSSYSDLEGLRVRLRLQSPTIGVVEPTPAVLIIENTTDRTIVINECSSLLTRWGLLPRGERGPLPSKTIIDCYDVPTTTIAGGATTLVPLEWGLASGFAARRPGPGTSFLGTLPGGAYTAVAVIPGSTGDIRVEIPVTVFPPPCPMTDQEATAYRGKTASNAETVIARDGRHIAVVSEDGEHRGTTWDLDCSRVRVHLQNGQVIDYTFG